jgi:hypothetical protein
MAAPSLVHGGVSAHPRRPTYSEAPLHTAQVPGVGRAFVDTDGELPEMRIGEWHLGRPLNDSLAADTATR